MTPSDGNKGEPRYIGDDDKPESCGASTTDHAQGIFLGATMSGAGYGCPEVIKGYLAAALAAAELGGHDLEALKADEAAQKEVAEAAANIVGQVKDFEARVRAQRLARDAGATLVPESTSDYRNRN